MTLKAVDVFTPGSFPDYTYVQRTATGWEQILSDSLETPGQIVSVSGPSKSGKTVLVEKVVGKDMLITITGGSITNPSDVWNQVLDWIDAPATTTDTKTYSGTVEVQTSATGSVGWHLVAKGEVNLGLQGTIAGQSASALTKQRGGLQQVVREIAGSSFVVLVDDFHYMPRDVQSEVAKSLKEAVRLGVKIVTASVTHRGDDVLRANPELQGRVRNIDLEYWNSAELTSIATLGFDALNVVADENAIRSFAAETAGSPQLMQLLCLELCFKTGIRERFAGSTAQAMTLSDSQLAEVLEETSTRTDYRSLVAVLDAGPPTRGTPRNVFSFHDGSFGDVYRAVLKGVASDPPQLSFSYDQLLKRTGAGCRGESPGGSSVTSTCVHMSRLAEEKFPKERPIDWDMSTQVFDLPDPYFMFYLRWSGRLKGDQKPARVLPSGEADQNIGSLRPREGGSGD